MTININEVPTSIPTVSGDALVAQVEAARDQAQLAATGLSGKVNFTDLAAVAEAVDPQDGWHIALTNADGTRIAGGIQDAPGGGVRAVFFDMLIPAAASLDDADGTPISDRILPDGAAVEAMPSEADMVLAVASADGSRLKFGIPTNDDPIIARVTTAVEAESVADGAVGLSALSPEAQDALGAGKWLAEVGGGGSLHVSNLSTGQRVEIAASGASDPLIIGDAVIYTASGARVWRPCDASKPAAPAASKLDAIVHYGDSLTASGDGVGSLGTLLGVSSINRGVGGWSVTDIALRAGAIRPTITITGNTLPSSGSVAVTSITPATGWSPYVDTSFTGTLAGVQVTLAWDHAAAAHTITRSTAGIEVSVPPGTPFIRDEVASYREQVQTIWVGRNAVTSATFHADTLAAVAALVEHLAPFAKRFVVIGVTNSTGETNSTSDYGKIVSMNAALAALYPHNFYDLRRDYIDDGLALAGITPTAGDLANIAADAPPPSLMADAVHPTTAGYHVQRQLVAEWLQNKGWF